MKKIILLAFMTLGVLFTAKSQEQVSNCNVEIVRKENGMDISNYTTGTLISAFTSVANDPSLQFTDVKFGIKYEGGIKYPQLKIVANDIGDPNTKITTFIKLEETANGYEINTCMPTASAMFTCKAIVCCRSCDFLWTVFDCECKTNANPDGLPPCAEYICEKTVVWNYSHLVQFANILSIITRNN